MNTAKKLIITGNEITQVLSLREMRKALSKKLDKGEVNLKKSESELIELLECGLRDTSIHSKYLDKIPADDFWKRATLDQALKDMRQI